MSLFSKEFQLLVLAGDDTHAVKLGNWYRQLSVLSFASAVVACKVPTLADAN